MQWLRVLDSRFKTCDARMAEFASKKELTDMTKDMSGVIEEVKVKMIEKKTYVLMKICTMGMKCQQAQCN